MRKIPVIIEVWGRLAIDITRKGMLDLHVHVVAILISIISWVSMLRRLLIVCADVLCDMCGLRNNCMVNSSGGRWR